MCKEVLNGCLRQQCDTETVSIYMELFQCLQDQNSHPGLLRAADPETYERHFCLESPLERLLKLVDIFLKQAAVVCASWEKILCFSQCLLSHGKKVCEQIRKAAELLHLCQGKRKLAVRWLPFSQKEQVEEGNYCLIFPTGCLKGAFNYPANIYSNKHEGFRTFFFGDAGLKGIPNILGL